jgi:hypothetical protein
MQKAMLGIAKKPTKLLHLLNDGDQSCQSWLNPETLPYSNNVHQNWVGSPQLISQHFWGAFPLAAHMMSFIKLRYVSRVTVFYSMLQSSAIQSHPVARSRLLIADSEIWYEVLIQATELKFLYPLLFKNFDI